MINKNFFTANRRRLLQEADCEVVAVTAYESVQSRGDAAAWFVQESNFWYLTGIEEPGWSLVSTESESHLIGPSVSEIHRVFEGGLSDEEAMRIRGVDGVLRGKSGDDLLRSIAATHGVVGVLGKDPHAQHYAFSLNPAPDRFLRKLQRMTTETLDIRPALLRLRAIKQPEEVQAIREVVDMTVGAFTAAKQRLGDCRYEYQLEAVFTEYFRYRNARHAYDPIVASGQNACTLHYASNSDALREGELVLLDIGASKHGYSADITRTHMVGKPAALQGEVHAAVQESLYETSKLLRPGLSIVEFQQRSDEIMRSALRQLGYLRSPDEYRKYFPHAIGHGLGVDVHDSLGGYAELAPGMVLTIEPGIYIAEEGVGVRLEDNFLITSEGYENLSEKLATDM